MGAYSVFTGRTANRATDDQSTHSHQDAQTRRVAVASNPPSPQFRRNYIGRPHETGRGKNPAYFRAGRAPRLSSTPQTRPHGAENRQPPAGPFASPAPRATPPGPPPERRLPGEGMAGHRCSRRPLRRATVTSLPRISMDSNSGGDTRRPETATRTGPKARRGL